MKKFIYKNFIVSFPILLLIVSINYFGDAAKIFHSSYEKKMAYIILNRTHVTNINNYDERIFQREIIIKIDCPPEIIVIGSSRTMLINSEYFPDKNFFNNSVSGASIEDLIAIFQIYKEHDCLPKKIIFGIDPWTFNDNNSQSRWKSIGYFYDNFHNKGPNLSVQKNSIYKYKEILSLSYFQSSIRNIPKRILGQSDPVPTKKKYNQTTTKLIDGSIIYGEDYRNASQHEINSKITQYLIDRIYSIENFDEISERVWKDFRILVEELIKNKSNYSAKKMHLMLFFT
jgi:hypothetical protein